MNFYRVVVLLAHQGTRGRESVTWHIATSATAADVMTNRGKLLAGVNRVLEVHAVTGADYEAVRRAGQRAFRVEPRRKG